MEELLLAALILAAIWRYLRYPTTWLILLLGYLAWRWLLG